MKLFKLLLTAFLLLLLSCSRNQPLGLKNHSFGQKGKHIVWIQVAGLSDEHLSMIKFFKDNANYKTSFENFSCTGKLWSYNLFELRPEASLGFVSQILGSSKITGKCNDIDRSPVWDYFKKDGYEVGIFEGKGTKDFTLAKYQKCDLGFSFTNGNYLWRQDKGAEGSFSTFHYQEGTGLDSPGVYFDKSCMNGDCFIPLKTNVTNLWSKFTKSNSKTFIVIRDFSYLKALKKRDILKAREILKDIDSLIHFFQESKKQVQLLVTSSEVMGIELPRQGKDWREFEKRGKGVIYRQSKLLGNAWAGGPGAENFCGIYEESEILRRLIWMPEKNLLNFSF